MKSTGIVRKTDKLGRMVLPIELRRTLGVNVKDPMEIFVDDDKIVLKKYSSHQSCHVTGEVSKDNLVLSGGKIVLSRDAVKQLLEELESQIKA